jgi:hypothetical protein
MNESSGYKLQTFGDFLFTPQDLVLAKQKKGGKS